MLVAVRPLLSLLPLPLPLPLLLLLSGPKCSCCVVSYRAMPQLGLGGQVAWLRRVGSCCSRCPPGSRGTRNLQGPAKARQAVRYMLPSHGMQACTAKKCGEGIRIATPDSNFGRLVGWRWVGTGFTGSTRIHCRSGCPSLSPPQALAHTHRETEPSEPGEPDRQTASARHTGSMFWTPRRSASHSTPSARQARPRPAVSAQLQGARPPTHSTWAPCPCSAQPCKHSGTLHLTSIPRVCACACLPIRPWLPVLWTE